MRIGQLARRLGIPPSDIQGYLASQNVATEAGANSRLNQEILTKVVNHFAPGKLAELLQTPAEEPVVEPVPVVEATEVVEEITPEPVLETPVEVPTPELPVEVIRVSKVELQGLKVLGKIDLPQPKKKEEVAEQSSEEVPSQQESQQPQQRPRREYQKRNDRNDRREHREWKNPVESKRQAEARELERKKKEKEERLKEKRTSHYHSKVKSVPTKAVRRIEEQTVVEDLETKEAPKGLFGRFLYWLRN